ncbi:MAG: hypothetical protein GX799_10940 [Crenarchaeota archaeon]|nr:hypothetical protein [Thermoproteota archaeon]
MGVAVGFCEGESEVFGVVDVSEFAVVELSAMVIVWVVLQSLAKTRVLKL